MDSIWLVFWEHWNYSDSSWGRLAVFSTERRARNFADKIKAKIEEWREVFDSVPNYWDNPRCDAVRKEAGELFETTMYGREMLDYEIEVECLPYDDAARRIIK